MLLAGADLADAFLVELVQVLSEGDGFHGGGVTIIENRRTGVYRKISLGKEWNRPYKEASEGL